MDMMERSEFSGADTQFERAERMAPWLPSINFMRAQALTRAGRAVEAFQQYSIAAGKAQTLSFQAHAALAASLESVAPEAAFQSYQDLLAPRHAPEQAKERARAYVKAYTDKYTTHGETLLQNARGWMEQHVPLLREHGFDFRGARVLEIGGSIVPAVCLLYAALGARVSTIDKFRTPETHSVLPPSAQRICYETIFRRLRQDAILPREWFQDAPPLIMDEILEFEGNTVRFDPERLDYHGGVDAAHTPFPDASFDLVASTATLEHVGDPDGDPALTAREIARLLKPGGWSAHQIDLRDHRDADNAPLEFLKYSDQEWRTMPVPQNQRANRWRMAHWRKAFGDAGLREVKATPHTGSSPYTVSDDLFASLHPDFQALGRDELSVLDCLILCRKPE